MKETMTDEDLPTSEEFKSFLNLKVSLLETLELSKKNTCKRHEANRSDKV